MPPEWSDVIISFLSVLFKDFFHTEVPGHTSGAKGGALTTTTVPSRSSTELGSYNTLNFRYSEDKPNNDRNKTRRRQFQFISEVKLWAFKNTVDTKNVKFLFFRITPNKQSLVQ